MRIDPKAWVRSLTGRGPADPPSARSPAAEHQGAPRTGATDPEQPTVSTDPWPVEIRYIRADRRVEVDFDTGETVSIPAELARVESPSAEVQGHGAGQKTLVRGKADVAVDRIEPVGNYAVRLIFDDGHSTGLFTWRTLLRLGRDGDALMADYRARCAAAGG